jgi:hypothetical protein
VLLRLELLDLGPVLLDLVLLLVELVQVALVQRRRLRHLAQVGPQPPLVLRDGLQLALVLADLALRLGQLPAQLLRLLPQGRLAQAVPACQSPAGSPLIGAKVVRHAQSVVFQLAEVAVPRQLFATILGRIGRLRLADASG